MVSPFRLPKMFFLVMLLAFPALLIPQRRISLFKDLWFARKICCLVKEEEYQCIGKYNEFDNVFIHSILPIFYEFVLNQVPSHKIHGVISTPHEVLEPKLVHHIFAWTRHHSLYFLHFEIQILNRDYNILNLIESFRKIFFN